ncbi:predicted aconitase subunit 2 [Dethiosulfatibacter aminovorans DSM 17477]|uniref:Predicted aconitase subunit 2 n=1 Tax=Dethiosulfatibacter aminovorans DSM 17477 TaxID=1121476 RepID=A0A1M6E4R4_9FIRM|nr:DUF126 domain-containing protein [Dethiosulfatibacter aminovorans]SHI80472.1 predicted aconitase subunit 2 [Dethiosulfatibacter aminovorans DSM 17477]
MKKDIKCRMISEGVSEGNVIVSEDAVCFYLVEPETGVVVEKNHSLEGKSIAGKILVMPSGKGSSVVQADGLFKLAKHDNAPLGIIVEYPDPVLVSGAIVMEIPMVDSVDSEFYEMIKSSEHIELNADKELITFK